MHRGQRHYAFRLCVSMAHFCEPFRKPASIILQILAQTSTGTPQGCTHWKLVVKGQRSGSLGPRLKNSQANYVYISLIGIIGHNWCSDYISFWKWSAVCFTKTLLWPLFKIVSFICLASKKDTRVNPNQMCKGLSFCYKSKLEQNLYSYSDPDKQRCKLPALSLFPGQTSGKKSLFLTPLVWWDFRLL